jgi:O-antigen/teichoic acid export membrane protein
MQKNFIAVALAFNILFFVFAEIIAVILFWDKFIESWIILKYSILFLTFNFLLQINFSILAWIWKIKERLSIILTALAFNFIANIILINWLDFINFKWIWVYWAALATSFWWILIWLLSEIKLWKKYFSHFDYKYFIKNIIILSALWIFCNYYIIPLFENLWRWISFWFLFVIWALWFIIFWIINLKEFRWFIWEIKKLKKWK